MNRQKIVAGNWKMNNDYNQTKTLVNDLKQIVKEDVCIMIAPSYTNLSVAKDLLLDSKIEVIAQNMHYSSSGAYTGDVSAEMLNSFGFDILISEIILSVLLSPKFFLKISCSFFEKLLSDKKISIDPHINALLTTSLFEYSTSSPITFLILS